MSFLRRLINRWNTTKIGGIGASAAVSSAAVLLLQGVARGAITSFVGPHLGGIAANAANQAVDSAVAGASAALLPAIAAAFVGRPPLLGPDPKSGNPDSGSGIPAQS